MVDGSPPKKLSELLQGAAGKRAEPAVAPADRHPDSWKVSIRSLEPAAYVYSFSLMNTINAAQLEKLLQAKHKDLFAAKLTEFAAIQADYAETRHKAIEELTPKFLFGQIPPHELPQPPRFPVFDVEVTFAEVKAFLNGQSD